MKIKKWCEINSKNKKAGERILPSRHSSNEEEVVMGRLLFKLNQKYIKKYKEINTADIEDEEDRNVIEVIRNIYDEFDINNSKTATKLGKTVASDISNAEIDKAEEFLENAVHTKEKENEGVDYNE